MMAATQPKQKERVFPKSGAADAKDVAEFFKVSMSTAYRMIGVELEATDVTDTIRRTTWEEIHRHYQSRKRQVASK